METEFLLGDRPFIDTFYSFKIGTRGSIKPPWDINPSFDIPNGGYLLNALGYLKGHHETVKKITYSE
jgi:hypothetical protein